LPTTIEKRARSFADLRREGGRKGGREGGREGRGISASKGMR